MRDRLPRALFAGYEATLERLRTLAHAQTARGRRRSDGRAPLEVNLGEGTYAYGLTRAWARVVEVLAFYQERTAEEGYVATARDPSALWRILAPLGAAPEPRAGVQAVFSVDAVENPGLAIPMTVPTGTPIRATTGPGKPSEIFEVREGIEIRGEWNEVALRPTLRPAGFERVNWHTALRLEGVGLGLRPGSRLLFLPAATARGDALPPDPLPEGWAPSLIHFTEDVHRGETVAMWAEEPPVGLDEGFETFLLEAGEPLFGHRAPAWDDVPPAVQIAHGGRLGGGLLRAMPGAIAWEPFNEGVPLARKGDFPAGSLALGPKGLLVAGTPSGVLVRAPDDAAWALANAGLTSFDVTAVAAGPDDTLFAGTGAGMVFRSTDGAKKWQPVDGEIKVVREPKAHRKEEDAWATVSTKLPTTVVRALAWVDDERDGPTLLAATDLGVFQSDPEGGGWMDETDGMLVSPPVRRWTVLVRGTLVLAIAGEERFVREAGGEWRSLGKATARDDAVGLGAPDAGFSDRVGEKETVTMLPGGETVRWDGGAWRIEGRPELAGIGSLATTEAGDTVVAVPSEGVLDEDWPAARPVAGRVDLARAVPTVVPGKWVVLQAAGVPSAAYRVAANDVVPRRAMMQSADVSRVALPDAGLEAIARYPYRTATLLAVRRRLTVAQVRDASATAQGASSLDLARRIAGVDRNRCVLVVGKRPRRILGAEEAPAEAKAAAGGGRAVLLGPDEEPTTVDLAPALPEDEDQSEIAGVASVDPSAPNARPPSTRLELQAPLGGAYDLDSVRVHLNMVHATHGRTVLREVLGSGDASQGNQSFALKQGPLVYTAPPDGGLPVSTLEVRVGGVPWRPVASFLHSKPESTHYLVRLDGRQHATVHFGDGRRGARLPSGRDNVTATYRAGDPDAGANAAPGLAFWDSKPAGVRGVRYVATTAPPTPGAEPKDAAARIALTLRTMDRAVTVEDAADLARGLSGVADAHAQALPMAYGTAVLLSLLPERDAPTLDPRAAEAYVRARQGFAAPVVAALCDPVPVDFAARLTVADDAREDLAALLPDTLAGRFGYGRWPLARDLRVAELVAFLQRQPGVLKVEPLTLGPSPATRGAVESARVRPAPEGEDRLGEHGAQAVFIADKIIVTTQSRGPETVLIASNIAGT